MFYFFSSIAIIVFEVICCTLFFESFCDKPKENKFIKKILLVAGLTILYFICALFLSRWLFVKQIAIIFVTTLAMMLYYKISIKRAFVFSFLYQGLLLLVDYVAYSVNSTIFITEDIVTQEYKLVESLVIVLGKIFLFLCVLIIKNKFGKKSAGMLVDSEWLRFLFFPTFTIIIISAITMTFKYVEDQRQAIVLYMIAFGMVGMNVFVYYLINSIIERETKLHEKSMYELQVKNQMEMYRSISENFERQKKKSHEFKNHILCIEGLLKEQQYGELANYVGEISSNISHEKNAINTNHAIINAILNTKYQEAIEKNIVLICRVNDLSKICFSDEDVVVLLANLLNNAIEACEKCGEKRTIKLKFLQEDDNIVLSVKNTYAQPVQYINDEIVTSKTMNSEEHGVGIKNIINIVEKYNGTYVINSDNDEFIFSIMFS